MKKKSTSLTLTVLLFGTFIAFLNQTLMNVALPSIMNDFGIDATQGQWLTNGYLLINGIMVPTTAYLIDRFKTRNLYLTIMTIFALGTLICGISDNFTMLIIGRMLQASGGGIVGPLLTVIVMRIYPMEHRGTAMGFIGLAMNFAPAIGPTLSGWIVQSFSWRYLFYLIFPLVILNILLAAVFLPNVGEQKNISLHKPSIILSSLGLGSLLLGFSNAGGNSWLSLNVAGYILAGVIILILFVRMQLKIKEPVLNLNVFKQKMFRLSTIANFFIIMGLYGGMLLLPLFLQNVKGVMPLKSGMVLLPGALSMAILSPITGNLFDKYGYKLLSNIGLSVLAIGTLPFMFFKPDASLVVIAICQMIRNIGIAMVSMPIQTEAMNSLPENLLSHGNAMYNTIRQVAGSIGTAVLITIMSNASATYASNHIDVTQQTSLLFGIHTAYTVTFVLTIIALILLAFIKVPKNNK
ncbi:MDR family MFS transporter [Vagococcus xieshaowenii]|uniref:DHA2 family efflux MFS transporter permease subunit n=1 Tax=Vagococcus xieshaowenii TaxID=2562451 RepID=A0AAJ5JKW0_9ENTE|nr:MDR family MFS transporter [Vagococcus xieshaowenii]QCA28658.1 DHA2 family efflux MFS transporter permease subunit [Vagococcus xieshaowenii]TFZ40535.1 DHA2 family efflux MFS transporter permease subunit [Vagococcus xieshaowenii]